MKLIIELEDKPCEESWGASMLIGEQAFDGVASTPFAAIASLFAFPEVQKELKQQEK